MQPEKTRPVLLYDGSCGFCRGGVAWLQRQIPEGAVEYLSTADPKVTARFPHLTTASLDRRMYLVEASGKTWGGARAIAFALKLSPGYRWLGIFLDFGPIRPFAAVGYWVFARLRHRFGKKSCPLP